MNCQQFQELLPYMIESGGSDTEEEHLRTCSACAELVRDLRYIAEQAKLLLPMREPSPKVWTNIEQSLKNEGLLTEGRMSPPGQIKRYSTSEQTKSWTPLGWIVALAATMAFTNLVMNYQPHLPGGGTSAQNNAQAAQISTDDDQQLVSTLSRQDPVVGRAYDAGLKEANAYITDAQQAVNRDPQDAVARQQLLEAYQQKEMLYQMATARPLH